MDGRGDRCGRQSQQEVANGYCKCCRVLVWMVMKLTMEGRARGSVAVSVLPRAAWEAKVLGLQHGGHMLPPTAALHDLKLGSAELPLAGRPAKQGTEPVSKRSGKDVHHTLATFS